MKQKNASGNLAAKNTTFFGLSMKLTEYYTK